MELRVYATALSFADSIYPDFGRRVSLFSLLKIAHHSMATWRVLESPLPRKTTPRPFKRLYR